MRWGGGWRRVPLWWGGLFTDDWCPLSLLAEERKCFAVTRGMEVRLLGEHTALVWDQ